MSHSKYERMVRSQAFMNVVVITLGSLPVVGVVTAFWTGEWRWLALLVFLCPFL